MSTSFSVAHSCTHRCTRCSPSVFQHHHRLFTTPFVHHPFTAPPILFTIRLRHHPLFTTPFVNQQKKRVFRSVCNQKHRIAVAGSIVGVVCSLRFAKRPDGSSPNRHDALFEILGTLSASCGEQPAHTEADVDCCPTRRRPVGSLSVAKVQRLWYYVLDLVRPTWWANEVPSDNVVMDWTTATRTSCRGRKRFMSLHCRW